MIFSQCKNNGRANSGATVLLFLWLCCGLVYVLPNHGGEGLDLPQNLLAWGFMALISLWCCYYFPIGKKLTLPAGSWLLIAGVVLWSLPLMWTPHADWRLNAFPRVIALWAMAGFYLLLLCTTACHRLRSRWLTVLLLASLVQAAYSVWQFSHLDELIGGRPYGSFQQINVLASFIATGLVCALWLFLHHRSPRIRVLAALALVTLPAILVIVQSRAGQLGALLAALLLIVPMFKRHSRRALTALCLLAAGIGTGVAGLHLAQHFFPNLLLIIDKAHSTSSRLYMLKLTWQLILQHPVLGNGYGSFEALFGQLAQGIPPGLEADTVKYPHNELLYAWVEGGAVALAGILLIVFGILKRLWNTSGAGIAGIALLLPIAVHMNLEYPLYQSATHGLTLVMLLVVCGGAAHKQPAPEQKRRWCRGVTGSIALTTLVFMLTGLQTQQRITAVEQQGLAPLAANEPAVMASLLNPYSQFSRLDFNRHVALLVRFNLTRDPALLTQFSDWAHAYLQVHNDPSVTFSLLMIARAQHLPEARALCASAKGMWPSDPRFDCHRYG